MNEKSARLTIHDIAKMANVSPGTVSRVISGKPGVGDETRQRIQELIANLNFTPNVSAQRLGSRRSWSVGLVFSRLTSEATAQPIFPEMIGAIADTLDEENYTLSLFSQARHPDRGIMQAFAQGKVDGVILPDTRTNDDIVNRLHLLGFLFVVIGQRFQNPAISWVDTNHDEIIENLTGLLIEKGHRRIALINGPENFSASLLRAKGFQAAMGRHGLPVSPDLVRSGEFSSQTGYTQTAALLSLPVGERPTAIVAGSDLIAVGCIQTALERGLRLPDDLAITGFDDNPIAQYIQPALTTAQAPIQEMGKTAAQIILGRLNGGAQLGEQLILPGRVVVRGSSG